MRNDIWWFLLLKCVARCCDSEWVVNGLPFTTNKADLQWPYFVCLCYVVVGAPMWRAWLLASQNIKCEESRLKNRYFLEHPTSTSQTSQNEIICIQHSQHSQHSQCIRFNCHLVVRRWMEAWNSFSLFTGHWHTMRNATVSHMLYCIVSPSMEMLYPACEYGFGRMCVCQ